MLSMWNAFIDNEGSKIISEIQNYPVLIGRRLKVQNYNGVALSTWFDSAILVNPPVQEARELKNWASRNAKCLADIVAKRTYSRYNPDLSFQADQKITDISNISSKHKV
nr:replication protein A 70 kDa DNA-binding subunit B-like [Coffea arabica]